MKVASDHFKKEEVKYMIFSRCFPEPGCEVHRVLYRLNITGADVITDFELARKLGTGQFSPLHMR